MARKPEATWVTRWKANWEKSLDLEFDARIHEQHALLRQLAMFVTGKTFVKEVQACAAFAYPDSN